jgi:pilus assembly protein CpaB
MGILRKFRKDRVAPLAQAPEGIGEIKPKTAKKFTFNKTTLAFSIAIVLGLIGVYTANSWISDRISAIEDEMRSKNKLVKVVVPKRDISKGERLTAGDLSVRKIPIAYVDRSTLTPDRFEVAVGQTLTHDIQQGRPILWAHLRGGEVPTFSGLLPDGTRALTVIVDEINTMSGMLQPQDRIDIFMTVNTSNNKKTTFPILQNVLVLATGKIVRASTQENAARMNMQFNTITVQVKPDEAKMIVHAQEEGKITTVLRHPEDSKPGPKTRITKASLLNASKAKKSSWVWIITGDS